MVPHSAIHQRGAIGLMAALTLGLALLFMLLVVDSGRLYLEQRKLQRIADMAALEAVGGSGTCVGVNPSATTLAREAALRNGHAESPDHRLYVECGSIESSASGLRAFIPDTNQDQAIRVTVSHRITSSIAAGAWKLIRSGQDENQTSLQAQATAGRTGPALARLTIRSSLIDINTTQSELLNTLLGDLLNTELNLSLAQWQGLLKADVNILHLLDALSISAGDYTELLHNKLKLSEIFTVMADVAAQDSPLVNVSGLIDLSLAAQNAGNIVLGDLLNIQNSGTTAGLNATLTALQLVQGMVELANSMHAVETTLSPSILGLANISTRIQIIEPPQFSAIGDPSLANVSPTEPGQIYVRTAQTRILIQADLAPLLGGLNLGVVQLTPNPRLDIGFEVASASSHVRGYDCSTVPNKRLTVRNDAAATKVLIGTIDSTAFFSSTKTIEAKPFTLLRVLGIDIGLGTNSPVFSQWENYNYLSPPDLDQAPPARHSMDTQNIVSSLGATLGGLELSPSIPLVGSLLNVITGLIGTLLGSLLDPVVNNLLALLGIDLNEAVIDANLSCYSGRPQLLL